MAETKNYSDLEQVLSNLHVASLAIGAYRQYGPHIRNAQGKPLIDDVDGVVVLNEDIMFEFTLAVKAYDALAGMHETRKKISCDLVHSSYENVHFFYNSQEFLRITNIAAKSQRQVA